MSEKSISKQKYIEKLKEIGNAVYKQKKLRRIWIFGLILTGFSLFIDLKLLFVILLVMVILTWAALNTIENEENSEIDDLHYQKEELERLVNISKEHIDSGKATLEEKIEFSQIQKELEEVNQLINEKS